MAGKIKSTALQSWDEVDDRIRRIAEAMIAIQSITDEQNEAIIAARSRAERLKKPMAALIGELEDQIEEYVAWNRADMKGRSRQLAFGTVGFRRSSKITYNTRKTQEIIERLKELGMGNCVRVGDESINRDVLASYPEKDIEKAGAKRKVTESFYCEPDLEKVKVWS